MLADGTVDQGGRDPFERVDGLISIYAGDVGEHHDAVHPDNQVESGSQPAAKRFVQGVAEWTEHLRHPLAAAPRTLVSRLWVQGEAERRAQTLLVLEGELRRPPGDESRPLRRIDLGVSAPCDVHIVGGPGPHLGLAQHEVLTGEVAVGGGPGDPGSVRDRFY